MHGTDRMLGALNRGRDRMPEELLRDMKADIDRFVGARPSSMTSPYTTLGAEEREIGGLGIFMVKKTMDRITYAYADGMNVLTIEKSW